ncbi:7tm Chemosensory receptor [Nesidiocoris tenuis]|uniref:7tm Chemosensory receptor n=1 Tax=Nesidiocoris tenuis TaxID=355587 RepID=A0ABN7AJR5_9HEMI|nr:7tm Chemosensory receptor [Nesidiocoris tenuis]
MSQSMRANWSSVIPCTKDFHSAIRTVKELVPLFDVQILAIVVVMLIQIVLSLFKLVARAIKDSSDIHSMIFTTTRAVIDWSSMCLLCNACEVFNEEVDFFHRLRLNLISMNRSLSDDAILWVCVNFEERVDFTARRFFRLGHPLLTSMIATVATYLVILLQFGRL